MIFIYFRKNILLYLVELNNCYFSTYSNIQSDLFNMFHFYTWLFFRKMIDIIYIGVIYEIKMYRPLQTKYPYIQICTVKVDKYNKIKCFCEW